MPIDWIAWGLLAADASVKAAAGLASTGAATKAGKAFLADPLEAALGKAYSKAFSGFVGVFGSFRLTYANEQALEALPRSEPFMDVVAQLPYVPFREIDPGPLRKAFLAIGIEGAEDADFDAAWRALGRSFDRAVSEDSTLTNLVQLSHSAREDGRGEAIRAYLEELLALQKEASKSADHEPAIRTYREAVLLEYQNADTRGLFMREKEGVGEEIGLREVFVETPLARIQQEVPEDRKEDGKEADRRRRQQETLAIKPDVLSIRDLLSRERLVVILGPPGCGKSTLLKCLALTLCQPPEAPPILEHGLDAKTIPLLLPLKQFASGLKEKSNPSLSDYFFDLFEKDLPNLHELLAAGRGLVLFDGLDEVFDETHRGWVSEEVWRFTARFPRSHFILTSRPRGYDAAPLPGSVPLWRLLPFDDRQIGQFFLGWFRALARVRGEAGAGESPERRAATLTQDVLSRDRLKEMAQNPLLCTLIVLVHRSRSGGRLPERRVVFLEAAVKTLAEAWERLKRSPQQADLDFPEPEILIRALAEAAWRAFHPKASREIAGDDLRRWLEEYLEREPDWKGGKGRRAVRDFLKLVGERTGLLVDLGGDRYQFVHLSLHEWLVSYFLLDRLNESERIEVFRYYLHAPQWEEILRLLVGGAPRAQADLLVSNVLDHPTSSWEKPLFRDLRFLFLCAGDQAPFGPVMRERLVQQGLSALGDPKLLDGGDFQRDLARLGPAPALAAEFRRKLEDRSGAVRRAAVEYFAQVGAVDEDTRRAVLVRLDDGDWSVRLAAVDCLAQVGAVDEDTCRAVLAKLGDGVGLVRRSALSYLARGGAEDESTRRAMLARLADENGSVCSSAIAYFAQLGAVDEETRRAVLAKLADEDESVRSSVVDYLAQVGAKDEEVRRAVLAKLADEDGSVRSSAVDYFKQIGADDEETRRAVLARLGDEDESVRSSAVDYFAQAGAEDEETRRIFLAKLDDEDESVRNSAADYFVQTGAMDEEVRGAFLARLVDEDESVRNLAIDYVTEIGAVDEETRRAVLAKLDDEDGSVRSSAVDYFAKAGAPDEETHRAVLAKLGDEDELVRSSVVDYLAQVGAVDEETRRAVLAKLDDEDQSVVRSTLGYFVATGFGEEIAEQLWEKYLSARPTSQRRLAERMGALMAEHRDLQDRILSEGRRIPYFYGPVMRALALEQDRLRRQANPLRLPNIPGS